MPDAAPTAPLRTTARAAAFAAAAVLPLVLLGCASGGGGAESEAPTRLSRSGEPASPADNARGAARRTGVADADADRVPLLINGNPVGWATLRPLLAEAAGAQIVDELALETALRGELRARGLSITDADVEAERDRWFELLGADGLAAETETQIRQRRGLGRERFGRLLWRNAALRALLDPAETNVTESEIRLAMDVRTGERYAVTGVVAPDSRGALALGRRAAESPGGAIAGLWTGAAEAGLRPWHAIVSPADPSYPEALRRVLPSTSPGNASGVVALDEGFGLVVVHARIPADPSAADRDAIAEELRLRKTRLEMERLARRLVDRTSVHAMDRHLAP